jgi:O-acetyl-ADP-ribose deacetylase (regulator of RNase III)
VADLARRIRLTLGDITSLEVEAVVTAANESLQGGGGVDGAVHLAAGPELVVASRQLAPCKTGDARITPGFNLAASHVIHAVGPVFQDGDRSEPDLLASAYHRSLDLAARHGLSSIAFPCISTGVFGFPAGQACLIAIDTVINWLSKNQLPEQVVFCCFQATDHSLYQDRLIALGMMSADN